MMKQVFGKVGKQYCAKFIKTGKLCNPSGYFERIEKCKNKNCKNII